MKHKFRTLPVGPGRVEVLEYGTTKVLNTHFFGENEFPEFYLGDADQYTVRIADFFNRTGILQDL